MTCKVNWISAVVSAAILLGMPLSRASALPVVPGAVGFGMDTPAGRGGEIYRVTNVNDSGAGSLRTCVEASGPRVCIFEVSGTISLASRLKLKSPYITIAGQTAPSPGVTIQGNELWIQASDVLIQHIRIRSGDGPGLTNPDESGPLNIGHWSNVVRRVVVDHVSVSWGIDENLGVSGYFDEITIRNCIISDALHDSLHSKGPHGKGVFISEEGNRVALIGNLLAHNPERNPLVRARDFVLAGNVIYNYITSGADLSMRSDATPLMHSIVGNLWIRGRDSSSSMRPIRLRSDAGSSAGSTQVYLDGNQLSGEVIQDQWALVDNRLSTKPAAAAPPNWFPGFDPPMATEKNFVNAVLNGAGARPADRDSLDARTVERVLNRNGSYINCVEPDGTTRCDRNAGSWSWLTQNSRALNLPSNPNGDDDGNGYTNLEDWLHEMARHVEMRMARPEPPIVSLE